MFAYCFNGNICMYMVPTVLITYNNNSFTNRKATSYPKT